MSTATSSASSSSVSVVLIGCGAPLRSMGWYHSAQILHGRVPHAKLTHVVEPFYLSPNATATTPGYTEFQAWKQTVEKEHGVVFHATVETIPPLLDDGELRLTILSARTLDNPTLFEECIGKTSAVFLEKPGAPTVAALESMRDLANKQKKPVAVWMGFNKNVSSYVTRSRAFVAALPTVPCEITFLHNNNYTVDTLPECFERNAEGMLKNMAIHELALLVTYYGITVDTIESVQADKEYSSCQTLMGPSSGKEFTDFDKLKFMIVAKPRSGAEKGARVHVAADRCGGDDSVAIVTHAGTGKELARFSMPDEETVANIPHLQAQHGDAMPYFFAQDPDYLELKKLVVNHMLTPSCPIQEVATIDVAIETLKVAEYLTPLLLEQMR